MSAQVMSAEKADQIRALVKELRSTPNWMRETFGSWKDCVLSYHRAPFQAADELERLLATLCGNDAETTAEKTAGNAMKSTACEPSKGLDTPTRD